MIRAKEAGEPVHYEGVEQVLKQTKSQVLLSARPSPPGRRMGVALARGASEREARQRADAAAAVRMITDD